MSEPITGAEQGALPPAEGQPRAQQATDRPPIQLTQVLGTNQYVLTTQAQNIPPLTQLTTSGSPTNNTITRIISISNIRNSNLSNQSIVNALTKPRTPNVRTQLFPTSAGQSSDGVSSSLAVPSASTGQITGVSSLTPPVPTLPSTQKVSPGSSPARKRPRLDDLPAGCENLSGARARAMQHKWTRSKCIKESYYEHCAELFFLETDGNMLDYFAWRKRPRSAQYAAYLRQQQLEPTVPEQLDSAQPVLTESSAAQQRGTTPTVAKDTPSQGPGAESRVGQTAAVTNTTLSTPVPESKAPAVATPPPAVVTASTSTVLTPTSAPITTVPSPRPATTPTASQLALNKTKSIVSAFPGTGSAEQIVEKAKQEAYVMQRISELQREGLWTERRLPKVQEVQRCKSHWDYLLEEMVWLAADFAQERKWKKAAAKKCARMVQKYFQDKALAAQKAEKAQELQLKRIASFIAKEIKTFWSNVEKLVEFKQQTRLEEKRKQALDQHLSFIVDQTEKYSQLLAEGMNKTADSANQTGPNTSRLTSPSRHSDDEFCPANQSSSDDEETIAQAEAVDESDKQTEEIAALQRESEMALEDFLNELPKDYLENRDKIVFSEADNSERDSDYSDSEQKTAKDERKKKDVDFKVDSGASEDDEDTIMEQEATEGSTDHKQELDDLQAENEMSIEELRKKYLSLPTSAALDSEDSKMSVDSDSASSAAEDESSQEESESSDVEVKQESEDEEEDKLGLKMLVEDEEDSNESEKPKTEGDDDHLINDVAALAESIQPKGNTLSSTSVVTPVPFLLKHPLREYQHIGLDWLVTMYERKLNGILADEMGLGKTIQTIALLAHLACEKGDWGPHLIIVPTSVMLNWEMECKKWCPGFKILTYYGTQKERKLKRTGWTKPNAFHICITSYKLVIQDHQSFRRKKWKYLILDEAQNIKNFKSQRWQLLLNFQTQQRLLLTGTPLQNNLMELWSLMHFLMPNVFQSHREFKEWFSNPVTGMIEGNSEYNESIIKRLHKVLRPFLLRRLKSEVEKQMPKKFEHIIMCRLSKRQRFLYDDYMSRAKTRETLATGNLLSVINVLMQLRKVCNHPNLFEVRPTVSPFQCEGISYNIPSIVYSALDYELFKHINLDTLYLRIINLEFTLSAYSAYATCKHRAPKKLIECIDDVAEPGPRPPSGFVHVRVKLGEPKTAPTQQSPRAVQPIRHLVTTPPKPGVATSPGVGVKIAQSSVQPGLKLRVAGPSGAPLQGYSVQIVSHQGGVKAIPVALSTTNAQSATTPTLNLATVGGGVLKTTGDQRVSVSTGFAQLVQTPLGKHILLTQSGTIPQASVNISGTTTVMTSSGQRLTVLSKPVTGVTSSVTSAGNKLAVVNAAAASIVSPSPQASTSTETASEATAGSSDSMALTRPLTASVMQQFRTPPAPGSSTSSSHMQTRHSSHGSDRKSPEDPFRTNWNDKSTTSRQSKLVVVHRLNEWRCNASPMYGADLRDTISMKSRPRREFGPWTGAYVMFEQLARGEKLWDHGGVLKEFVKTPQKLVQDLQDMFSRFVFCVPSVSAKPLTYRVLNPPQSKYWGERRDEYRLMRTLSPKAALLHPIASAMVTQFPDPRLIQYDCGKLQTLDLLLRRLKSGGHRALIFTQMTRMLDVLEAFLNFHGHIYLRLDGTTKVDQRQVLMERFNGNTKIFAFILSTRSGGVGVNLTGADTVIFYDSDWNPTMDAQAQDRCHRIGQTRDVHIYRLISEMTIEENILKKANQKRMLGDLAIEGGNFTTAYFKSSTIQDLFNVDTHEEDANQRMSEVLNKPRPLPDSTASGGVANGDDRAAIGALENALAACEDDQDVQAAKTAKAEAVADLAEFDESIPLEDHEKEPEMSKAEQEVQNLIKQLTPIERYAMKFVEETEAAWSAEQLAAAEREIEAQKREWEANRLAALRQEEERRARQLDDDSEQLTFSRDDATNQIWVSDNAKEQMPMWCPPTPPSQDSDMYIDYSMGFLYEMSVMSESQLPPVYIRKEAKRNRHEAGLTVDNRRALKIARKDEVMYEPRSLFDRPSPEMLKMRRELKQQRYRGIIRPQLPKSGLKVPTVTKPQPDPPCWHPWTIHEDMALLKVIQTFQGLPLNLMIVSPGHTPNWDFAADYVNCTSITYRSAKQCRHRYENVLISREEGKILYDTSTRKKKTKNIYTKYPQQFKSNRPMRTAQLYTQDNNSSFSQLMIQRFDSLKQISSKRSVTTKSAATNSHMKNPKHTAVLTEYGIDYEHPLTPVEVATRRAERIQREKQKLGSMTTDQQQQRQAKPATSTVVSQPASIVPVATSAQPTTNVTTTTIIVSQQSTSGTSGGTVVTAVATPGTPPSGTTTLRTQRLVSSPLQAGTVTNVTGLTQAHLTQRLIVTGGQPVATKAGTAGGTATVATSKSLTPAQLQYYRQQMLKQQQLRVAQALPTQTVKGVTIAGQVAVTQGQQRTQFVKQQTIAVAAGQTKQTIPRTVTDSEMAALIKRQQQLQQQQQKLAQAAAAVGVSQSGQATTVQTLTQAQQAQIIAGIQVQQAGTSGAAQVATLVKAVSAAPGTSSVTIPVTGVTLGPQVKAALAAAQAGAGTKTVTSLPSQVRQLQIHHHLLQQQKKLAGQKITQLAQVAGKAGVATQLIVQAPKTTTMTMQQLQHVMRQPQLAVSQGQVVLAKAGPAARVIPVNAGQGLKQTIQVVTATSAAQAALVRPQVSVSSSLAGALAGAIKVTPSGATTSAQQQAILSQVSAALQGQVRQSGSPVRIQTTSGTPLVAVTVQSTSQQQSTSSNDQVGHQRVQKK